MAPSKRMGSSEASGMGPCKKTRTQASPQRTRNVATRSMTRTSTTNAVFLTTELLESILVYLPMKDLLLVQRVCQKWREVIAKSPQLQQNMFMKAARPTVAWKWSDDPRSSRRMDRLAEVPSVDPFIDGGISLTASLNSLLLYAPYYARESTAGNPGGAILKFKDEARWRHKTGSWRRMFVTQPPATVVYAEYITGDWEASRSGYGSEDFDLLQPGGVTLGELVDHALKLEADGEKVNWDRCWFQAWCRVFPSEEEAKMATIEA